MKSTLVFTALVMLASTQAHAMSQASADDLAAASEASADELKSLNKDFYVSIRERISNDSESTLLTAEVETLPGAEVARPWVLTTLQPSIDGLDRDEVGPFETAQFIPADGTSDGRTALRTQ